MAFNVNLHSTWSSRLLFEGGIRWMESSVTAEYVYSMYYISTSTVSSTVNKPPQIYN